MYSGVVISFAESKRKLPSVVELDHITEY